MVFQKIPITKIVAGFRRRREGRCPLVPENLRVFLVDEIRKRVDVALEAVSMTES